MRHHQFQQFSKHNQLSFIPGQLRASQLQSKNSQNYINFIGLLWNCSTQLFNFHFHLSYFLCFSLSLSLLFTFTAFHIRFFMGFQNTFSCHPPAKLGGEKKLMNAPLTLFTFTFHRLMRYFELLSISQRSVSWWSFVYVLFMFTFVAFHFHFSKYDEMPPIIRNWC